jgi:hypothetical protein
MPSKPQRRRRDAKIDEPVPTEGSPKPGAEEPPGITRSRRRAGNRTDRERAKGIDAP